MESLHLCCIFLLLILFFQYPPVDAKPAEVDLKEDFEDTKRSNQIPYIEEEQTTQCPTEKVQKDNQRPTNIHIKLKIGN